jgi:FHS family L-fucose permease-like MFS transporter
MRNEKSGLFLTPDGKNVAFTFCLVTSLFFLWAVCNGMIDVMDKHFQEELGLSKSQSAWVQFAHYLGYFLMAVPAGWLASKLGYKKGIIGGLLIVTIGGLWFIPATRINAMVHLGSVTPATAFVGFLAGVCVIATGLTFLETIANPYTTVLGNPAFAQTRINLAQSFNGLGWIVGPPIGGLFFYGKDAMGRSTGSETLYIPYVGVALAAFVIATVFMFSEVPDIRAADDYQLDDTRAAASHSIWSHPHFVLAVAAQFFYVAAQAGIFSYFINYMTAEVPPIPASWATGSLSAWFETTKAGTLALSDKGAANLASVAFGCFVLGRFSGAALLRRFSAHKLLGLYGLANVVLCLLVFFKLGWLSVVCVFLSYFFMSIMFPTIFALGIHGLGARAKKASSFIVMAIMGGALLPKVMGYVADLYDMSRGFIVPMFCFAFVAYYALKWPRLSGVEELKGVKAAGH